MARLWSHPESRPCSVSSGFIQTHALCNTIGLVLTPPKTVSGAAPSLVVTLPWLPCVSSQQQQLCQHQQSTCGLPASPVCREQEVIFQLLSDISAALCRLLEEADKQFVRQKNLLFVFKASCTVSHEYICDINAAENSSLFLGVSGQIKS